MRWRRRGDAVLTAATDVRAVRSRGRRPRPLAAAAAKSYRAAACRSRGGLPETLRPFDADAVDRRRLPHGPTDERLKAVAAGQADPHLIALYFQFGRYLLIASSRPGSMAANLQGIWNDSLAPPWESKYTININTEMNYWPAEITNLSELHEPLFDLIDSAREDGRRVAKTLYGAGGFVHPSQHRSVGRRRADRRRGIRHLADGRRLAQPASLGSLRLHARRRVPPRRAAIRR